MREEKIKVRNILRERREKLTPQERLFKSETICKNVFSLINPGETVMAFTSKELEVNTGLLLKKLLENKNPLVVPIIVTEDVSLRLSYLKDLNHLVPSTFGVPEPIGNEISVPEGAVDIVILPMLGFDRKGGRIGYGAGYYDRFLEKYPDVKKIGLAFKCQELENIPLEDNDVLMDFIVTEEGIAFEKK